MPSTKNWKLFRVGTSYGEGVYAFGRNKEHALQRNRNEMKNLPKRQTQRKRAVYSLFH
jgi:hypothetical protein